ncbi:HAMP domain-containing histidine kinase [Candidatus Roizmanbacteria bacterium]|nr:HAMP domain-containing histidine kinase [Candidatus Roizmanbacteria bacterium]
MLNIFQSARIKLTLWYLLIIATISGIFSMVIYQGIVREIEQGYYRVEARFIDEKLVITPRQDLHSQIIAQNIRTTKQRVQILLLYANGVILIVSGAIAYYLAGQTLKPIAHAMSEQKRFIEDASHELKTPLTALKTAIEVALRNRKLTKKEATSVLSDNLSAVNTLQILTEDMLRLSRYNKKQIAKLPVLLNNVIKSVIKTFIPLATKKKISIKKALTPVTVIARTPDMEKLFSAIFENALAYTSHKGIVDVYMKKKRTTVEIDITDNGIGIPKKDLPHIFDRFYRADQARSRKDHNGYGLGLPIAKQIIDQYGGTIEIKSKENVGTLVRVTFPRVDSE